jgi:predicted nuclease of restriction endonuclease-like (RecB) superfamily
MRQFYETYWSSKIVSPVARQLQQADNQQLEIVSPLARQFEITDIRASILCKITWTNHLIILTKTKTTEEREFYIRLCIQENYGKRELERQITTGVFERAILDKQELSSWPQTIKTNYVFEFLNLPGNHNENDLRTALIHQMKNFILELGKDFIFMGDEYRIKVGDSDFFIDLLFYHRGLQCLVAFELKTEKFKPEYLGKLNFYLEGIDRDLKKEHEKSSIGILLCPEQDAVVVEYALSRSLSPALVSKYQLQLPDKKLLEKKFLTIVEQTESCK